MKTRAGRTSALMALAALLTSATLAGPVWDEAVGDDGDAGSRPNDLQITDGSGELGSIEGKLEGAASAGRTTGVTPDFEDMYAIRICDPVDFKASTVLVDGGFADFNTQLWLFQPSVGMPLLAFGRLGNDNTAAPPTVFSRLLPDPTDGSPSLTDPGIYYIAISGFDNDPLSDAGPIFMQVSPVEISGPDGDGGGLPITDWNQADPLAIGTYRIRLGGVTFATQVTFDCNGNGVHDMCDIAFGPSTDVNANQIPDECEADLDGDGDVDVTDLLMLLGMWGPCSGCPADFDGDGMVGAADLLFMLAQWS